MHGLIRVVHRFQWANVDLIRALGSLYTLSYEESLAPGLFIHYALGILFAFVYAFVIGLAPVSTPWVAFLISAFVSIVHGVVVGLLLDVFVAEHHPLKRFRKTGMRVVSAYVFGHVFYGLTLGAVFAATWKSLGPSLQGIFEGRGGVDFLGFMLVWWPIFGVPILFFAVLAYLAGVNIIRARARKEVESKKPKKMKRAG